MASGERRSRERYWRGVIARQRKSGLSVTAFCREHGITEASFYYWRRKETWATGADGRQDRPKTSRFVAIDLAAPPTPAQAMEVVLRDGRRVVVPPQFDASQLKSILTVLEEASC